jgi:hypothetical protein
LLPLFQNKQHHFAAKIGLKSLLLPENQYLKILFCIVRLGWVRWFLSPEMRRPVPATELPGSDSGKER